MAERRAAAAAEAAAARDRQIASMAAPEAALRHAAHMSQIAWSRAAAQGFSLAARDSAWKVVVDQGRRSRRRSQGRSGDRRGYRLSFLEGEEVASDDRDDDDHE